MDLDLFCKKLPKIELHAHLNGSLSQSTMLQLKRHLADAGIGDETNAFFDEFQIGSGDARSLSECFQVFDIAHSLTSTSEALALATSLTLQEFEEDGCCYIELRSTPRDTSHMNKRQYIQTIIEVLRNFSDNGILSRLIVSINRSSSISDAENIVDLTIEYFKKYPDVIVGIELSGNPAIGKFETFLPPLTRARDAGLNITLHCGEISNTNEILQMLEFKPDRIGHGTCIHPRFGGSHDTWDALSKSRIPIEVCLTSNVKTKSTPDYMSHHFKELYVNNLPIIICTDDKGVFATSLSQEYKLCAYTFNLNQSCLAKLSLNSCQYIFAKDVCKTISDKIQQFISDNSL